MSYHNVRNKFGRFATKGKASKGVAKAKGSKYQTPEQAKRIRNQGYSYGVYYVRTVDLDGKGNVRANGFNPSPRRFATIEEARHHAARFVEIAKHLGSYVVKVNQKPNAWVNWVTGKTNPILSPRYFT